MADSSGEWCNLSAGRSRVAVTRPRGLSANKDILNNAAELQIPPSQLVASALRASQ